MSGFLGLFQLTFATFAALACGAALAASAAAPLVLRRLDGAGAESRARWLRWLALAPLASAALLTAACFLPSTAAWALGRADHCQSHDDDHAHFCLRHRPLTSGNAAGWACLGLAASGGILAAAARLRNRRRLGASIAALPALEDGDTKIVQLPLPCAFAFGGKVHIASSLRERLPEAALRIVVDHERAHLRRRDALQAAVVDLATLFWTPAARRALREAFALACEQACDEVTASGHGRAAVAETILLAERALPRERAGLPAPAFHESDVAARVTALLAEERPQLTIPSWPAAACLALLVASCSLLHHGLEAVLAPLLR